MPNPKPIVCLGSRALVYRGLDKNPVDLDLVGREKDLRNYCSNFGPTKSNYPIDGGKKILFRFYTEPKIVEAEIAWRGTTALQMLDLVAEDSETIIRDGLMIPSLDFLYLIKMSHRYLKNSSHFKKTMDDIKLLRSLGAKIKPKHRDFYLARKKETYDYSHPKLNVDKESFFRGDGVKYIFDHDSIHEAIKILERPAYSYFQKEGEEVFCSKEKFFELDLSVRLLAVLEETYVLALERSQIPFRGLVSADQSFEMALTKVCTSITSGWFREFAWEHWDQVMELKDPEYATKFFQKSDAGLVLPY